MSTIKETLFAKAKTKILPVTFMGEDMFYHRAVEKDRIAWRAALVEAKESGSDEDTYLRCRVIQMSLCDAEGNLVFSVEDIPAMHDLPLADLSALYETITAATPAKKN